VIIFWFAKHSLGFIEGGISAGSVEEVSGAGVLGIPSRADLLAAFRAMEEVLTFSSR
jgi:hypothetical protein